MTYNSVCKEHITIVWNFVLFYSILFSVIGYRFFFFVVYRSINWEDIENWHFFGSWNAINSYTLRSWWRPMTAKSFCVSPFDSQGLSKFCHFVLKWFAITVLDRIVYGKVNLFSLFVRWTTGYHTRFNISLTRYDFSNWSSLVIIWDTLITFSFSDSPYSL